MTDEGFLTTEEVLEYLQVNLRTVYRLIKAGKIPAVRVGRQWRFRKRDIDIWLEQNRTGVPAAMKASERPRILIVDDDPAVRRLLVETLSGDGLELREAADGAHALSEIARRVPDAVLLDLMMPGVDGFTVLERLHEDPSTRLVPVIVLTARRLDSDERRLLAERTLALLDKAHYSPAELRALVSQALART